LKQFTAFNLGHGDCISITFSKILGYVIILGAIIVKLPQIISIVRSGSGKGILPSMYYSECLAYIINGCYIMNLGASFSVYGENVMILIQNVMIILLIWTYEKGTPITTKAAVITGLSSLSVVLYLNLIPDYLWSVLMNGQMLIVLYSKIPQIIHNFKEKSTGQLSIITYFLNASGNCARMFTVFKESPDFVIIMNVMVSLTMNFTLVSQILLIGNTETDTKKVENVDSGPDNTEIKRRNDGATKRHIHNQHQSTNTCQ
jgi:mannose-P-dolichol utilization defect protein 1